MYIDAIEYIYIYVYVLRYQPLSPGTPAPQMGYATSLHLPQLAASRSEAPSGPGNIPVRESQGTQRTQWFIDSTYNIPSGNLT